MLRNISRNLLTSLCFILLLASCQEKKTAIEEKLYSRHLQDHYTLTIINTAIPSDKKELNLILLNDGQDMKELRIKEIMDSLYDKGLIQPCVIVGIHALHRMEDYGVAGVPDYQQRGAKAEKYSDFINNELYPFVKKKSGVRKFKSVTMAGWSLGGLSAFDVAWAHADKISKVGVFSGSFWWRNKDVNDSTYNDIDNRIMVNKIRATKKKPKLKYWFYVGGNEETADRDKDSIIDAIDDTRDVVEIMKMRGVASDEDIIQIENQEGKHELASWSKQFPAFLTWAIGK